MNYGNGGLGKCFKIEKNTVAIETSNNMFYINLSKNSRLQIIVKLHKTKIMLL